MKGGAHHHRSACPPGRRPCASTVWLGDEVIIWGGQTSGLADGFDFPADGVAYNPDSGQW